MQIIKKFCNNLPLRINRDGTRNLLDQTVSSFVKKASIDAHSGFTSLSPPKDKTFEKRSIFETHELWREHA
mgnify:CR=1 FL=1